MIAKLLYRLSGRLPCRIISRDGNPYLERYYVGQFMGLTFYLHRFVNGDGDEEVHDHPWKAVALVLTGMYIEQRVERICTIEGWQSRTRFLKAGQLNFINDSSFHKIETARPETWTLFIHGRFRKGWGFLTRSEHCLMKHPDNVSLKYYMPFELRTARGKTPWWTRSPIGKEASREPLGVEHV